MNTSFCITSYDQDYYLLPNLLGMLQQQTVAPNEIIIYVSGVSKLDLPNNILINQNIIPIYTVFSSKRSIQSVARNICAKIASQDIVIFFDVDDEPHPQKLEITKLLFQKYQPDFMVHNYILSHNRMQPKFNTLDPNYIVANTKLNIDINSTNIVCENMPIHHAHIAVKKEIFKDIYYNENTEFYRKEDGKFCQDLIRNGYKGIYCMDRLVRYIV